MFRTVGKLSALVLPLMLLWLLDDWRFSSAGNNPKRPVHRKAAPKKKLARVLAMHFPQFHEFEVNNRLHGQGYTDFKHIPELTHARGGVPVLRPLEGFYNLMDTHVRRRQAQYAKAHNIHGFVYYHYWFKGAPVMDAPLQAMLKDGEPNISFAISWANEPWTARWNGGNNDVLMEQTYDGADARPHFDWLLPFWKHPNYILKDGKPVFFIYRIHEAGNKGFGRTMTQWDKWAEEAGFPGIYVVQTNGIKWTKDAHNLHPMAHGMMEFFPNFFHHPINSRKDLMAVGHDSLGIPPEDYMYGMCTHFNNKPRHLKDDGESIRVWHPTTMKAFLKERLTRSSPKSFIVINAWNEWGEGAALEPSVEYGFSWLQAVKEAVDEVATGRPLPHVPPAGIAPADGNAGNSLCIVVRTYVGHDDSAMFPLRRMLQTLVSLEHSNWEAFVIDTGDTHFVNMTDIAQSFGDPRIRPVDTPAQYRKPYTGKLSAYDTTDYAVEEHCVRPGKARWFVVTNGDNWYAPDAFNDFPPEADRADMQLLNFLGRYTLVNSIVLTHPAKGNCCSRLANYKCTQSAPRIGFADVGAMVIRASSWAAAGLSFNQFTGACGEFSCHDGALAQHVDKELHWRIASHPGATCALFHNPNPISCAMVGGFYWDTDDWKKDVCSDPFFPPIPLKSVNWYKFQSTAACMCES